MSDRFARRSTTGYYRPLPDVSSYGIGLKDHLTDTSKWLKVVSADPFNIVTDTHLDMLSSDAHNDFMYWKALAAPLTDQFSQMAWSGLNAGDGGATIAGGGLVVRHTGASWPNVRGYYFVIEETSFSGFPVYSWSVGRYIVSGGTVARSAIISSPGVFTPGTNDVFTLQVTGSVTPALVVLQNGSALTSTTDTNPTPFLTGYPGLIGGTDAVSARSWFSWINWSGGALTPAGTIIPQQFRGSGYYPGTK